MYLLISLWFIVVFSIVPPEDVAIIEGRDAVCQALGKNVINEELAGLFVVDSPWSGV